MCVKRFPSPSGGPDVEVGPVVDCHQHVWPAALVEALRRRTTGPRVDGSTLHLDGEPASTAEVDDADGLDQRRKQDDADGVDLALLSLSTALGVEALDPDQAAPLLEAWHALADDLGQHHGLWAATNLVEPDLAGLREQLAHDRVVGLQLPATAFADPGAVERLAPVLDAARAAACPCWCTRVPRPRAPTPARCPAGGPPWPTTSPSRPRPGSPGRSPAERWCPHLRIAFVALAGLAPLHHERLAQRGGRSARSTRCVYYETSSYGARAIDAMVRVVGVDPMVHGSDRPYAEPVDPGLGDAFSNALFVTNPHRLLKGATR